MFSDLQHSTFQRELLAVLVQLQVLLTVLLLSEKLYCVCDACGAYGVCDASSSVYLLLYLFQQTVQQRQVR